MSRWLFRSLVCLVALAALVAGCAAPPPVDGDLGSIDQLPAPLNPGDVRLRLMAANITSGNYQSYDPGEGTRIFQGTDPDVVMIQEFNYGSNSAADIRAFVDLAFGTSFSYYREGGAQIPNGIISRYPILASGEWTDPRVSNRDFAWAKIDIPGPVDLWAISVHLLTTSTTERNLEAQELVAKIQQNIPPGDYVAIGGDYNTGSRTESCISTLSQVVTTSSPYPVDRNGNANTNAGRTKPYDWVLVSSGLHARRTSVDIGASSFANGLVADTRVYSPISEISPALSTDSGATNMQHMGIVRDFGLPGEVSSSLTVASPNGGESWAGGSSHAITWTSSGVTNVKLEYTLNGGTSWTVITSSTSAAAGSYSWTVPSSATTSAKVRATDTANASLSDTSNASFTITTGGGGGAAQVFINEVLANEAGSDTNGEFVELVNSGGTAADLSGWTLSDATAVRHTFAAGTSLGAGQAIVVFAGASAIPGGLTNAVASSTGSFNLSNSGDTVTLKNASSATVDTLTYTSALSGTDGVSMNRSPDGTAGASLVLHNTLASAGSSPGKRVDGTDFGSGGGGGGGSSISAETESNDTAATANGNLGNNKNVSASISSSSDVDWFKFTANSSGTVTVTVTVPGSADLDWYLYSASDTTSYLARGYTASNPEQGSYTVSSAGQYLVKVVGYGGDMSDYTLNVSAAAGVIDP